MVSFSNPILSFAIAMRHLQHYYFEYLNLSGNELDAGSVAALVEGMKNPELRIKSLNLSYCKISRTSAVMIGQALYNNSDNNNPLPSWNVEILNLSNNHIDIAGIRVIFH
jgi:hypothetical protein